RRAAPQAAACERRPALRSDVLQRARAHAVLRRFAYPRRLSAGRQRIQRAEKRPAQPGAHRMIRALSLLFAAFALPLSAADVQPTKNAGPYVPSPQSVVSDMLRYAEVGADDFLIDLGSGDGRIVLTAAKVFGARGFGVEIKDELVRK